MSRYRTFWIWPKRKGEIFGSIISNEDFEVAINEHCLENSFQVTELAALEACQKRLDEAVGLLKDAKNNWGDYAPQGGNARKTFNQIDTFLKGLGEG